MARGFILSSQSKATTTSFITRVRLSPPICQKLIFMSPPPLCYLLRLPPNVTPTRSFCCKSSLAQDQIDVAKYKEAFSRQMAVAGLKRHHRIAIGVSGGPDSIALCFLTAAWKTECPHVVSQSGGFIDGLLAIVVDHGLRAESKEEARIVSRRVSEMGIRCEIAYCSWSDGRPKQGHLQEEARDMRYQKLQNICMQHRIGVLLIAHHADDQAELFILRLSRNSGVLGLAGMAFTSQTFSSSKHLYDEGSNNEGILIVRPLLHFSKEDMYKVCQVGGQDWVDDPTNQSLLYARNRIRMSLRSLSSYTFKSELQAVISACRKTRAFVDQFCFNLINQALTIVHQGYAIIDLEILNPSKIVDLCLAKFIALVLQFVSQRQRPVRGRTSKLLLDYIRTFPCKTSLTAAGCYLCPATGSRGTKILVCCSVDCPLPSKTVPTCIHSVGERKWYVPCELEQIISDGKLNSDHFVPDASDVYFLDSSSDTVLTEAKRLNIISESTYKNILLLQRDEIKYFKARIEDNVESETQSKDEVEHATTSLSEPLRPGQICYFMNRFLVTWKLSKNIPVSAVPERSYCDWDLGGESWYHHLWSCTLSHDMVVEVRHMIETDWLYLAKLLKCASLDNLQQQRICTACEREQSTEKRNLYLDYLRFSAERALKMLKSTPVAARRSLPVLVNNQGLLLSIPSIGFKNCPCLTVSCVFKPRVPLGGGHSSFMLPVISVK
ncbi:hypothetical protein P3X46_019414 [Hevea brasiliensis]|uniref:tRNA(Ile)-lysidine synthetase n=1 Tax=Hevea brasiliensis TaxID=3981 RepID=A0ABQ9LIM1_HEVBR|nr:uncharacterized protein LOC110671794 isoform X2 [Hevea brasiliensis]KAJ9167821.1 hypothetical protein P3X46_019414 [Hevea brasiliensis]